MQKQLLCKICQPILSQMRCGLLPCAFSSSPVGDSVKVEGVGIPSICTNMTVSSKR